MTALPREFRIDGLTPQGIAAHVTGSARSAVDLVADGMLHARILVSPHAHAVIRAIDLSRARALPGVVAVLTHADCAAELHDGLYRAAAVFTRKARFVGDWIAAVAAETGLIAEEALGLIDVDYELLPAVLDPTSASQAGAPLVHDDIPGNIAADKRHPLTAGDTKAAFAAAVRTVEFSGVASRQLRGDFGQQAALASFDSGGIPAVTSTSPVSASGTFSERSLEAVAVLLARASARPVRVPEPDTTDAYARQASAHHSVRMAADASGAIVGLDHAVIVNAGAYSTAESANVGIAALAGAMRFGSVSGRVSTVHTHTLPAGAADAIANPDGGFILQQALDMLAEKMAADPIGFRIRNLVSGDAGARMEACIRAGADRFGWSRKWQGWKRHRASGGRYLQGVGLSILSRHHAGQIFGHQADFVEVEVDTETGFVVLLSHVCALDVTDFRGLPNPVALQASVVRSIGNAMIEGSSFGDRTGSMPVTAFGPLRAPTIMDAPDLDYVFVGAPLSESAAGGHDPAQAGSADLAPAMANAICDATGIRVNTLPFSADKILRSLRDKGASAPAKSRVRGHFI